MIRQILNGFLICFIALKTEPLETSTNDTDPSVRSNSADLYSPKENSSAVEQGQGSFNERSDSPSSSCCSSKTGYQSLQSSNSRRSSELPFRMDSSTTQTTAFNVNQYDQSATSLAYPSSHCVNTRDVYDDNQSPSGSFGLAQRQHGLPNDAYAQNFHWYHSGPPAYM